MRLLLIFQRKAIRHYNYIRGDTSCKKEHLNQKTKNYIVNGGKEMYKNTRIYRGIVLVVLLLCTVYLIYSIVTEPVGKYGLDYIVLALAVTAGFIALGREKRQKCS